VGPEPPAAAAGGRGTRRPSTHERGVRGEERAAEYLRGRGWTILARNVRSRHGEVDLVAARGETLAFVEVKAWRSLGEADLEQAIGPRKRRRIGEAARLFLARRPDLATRRPRFDVLFLGEDPQRLRHIEDAFGE
jgi:putative endonuclease